MNQQTPLKELQSLSWFIILLLGFVFSVGFIGGILSGFASHPVDWEIVWGALVNTLVILLPFVITARILWACRDKKLPSLAFIITFLTGCFFFLFSFAEFIGGLTSSPMDSSFVVGGLLEILTFALPFLVASWLLWFHPKMGAILLIVIGIALGIWMGFRLTTGGGFLIVLLLTGFPIILGVYTFIREIRRPRTNQNSTPG